MLIGTTFRVLERKLCPLGVFASNFSTVRCYSNDRNRSYGDHQSGAKRTRFALLAVGSCAAVAAGSAYLSKNQLRTAFAKSAGDKKDDAKVHDIKICERKDLPTYRLEEVKKHGREAEKIWVTYQGGVYDITDFIEGHPGGDKILLAAGGSMDPYWKIYQQHQTPEVVELLEEFRIGNLDPRDIIVIEHRDEDDPYRNDPKRHPALLVNSKRPFNAETPVELIMDEFRTPNDLFFVRNHMPVPKLDAKTHRVKIEGIGVKRRLELNLADLRNNFKQVSVDATLQCAGNRRSEMAKFKKVQGLNWKGTAIGNAKWTGVRLRDVLIAAGVNLNDKRIKHVQLGGADVDAEGHNYGASITFEKAVNEEVIIAHKMNDEDIPRDHGYPFRLIAPGIVGARQVKWLKFIKLSEEESQAHWQQKDYRGLPPTIGPNDPQTFEVVPSIQEYPIQCAFCIPSGPKTISREEGEIDVAGYAWSGGGRGIIRVEVSADGGKTWLSAELEHSPDQDIDHMWAWTFFRATVKIPDGADHLDLVCKATDRAYNTQPETALGIWNVRGLLHNAWHHVRIDIKG